MTEFWAAVAGALLAGAIQLVDRVFERRRRRESTVVALASEVFSVCSLIRHQSYLEKISAEASLIRSENWNGGPIVIDIRANYFSVFESLAPDLGLLTPCHVAKFVAFYAYCKSVIDSTRPDGPQVAAFDEADKAGNVLALEGTLMAILALGDEIATFPRHRLPEVLGDD